MEPDKLIYNFHKKKQSYIFLLLALSYLIFFLMVGYKSDIISNSELITYKLFFNNPDSIIGTYNHWLPNYIGSQIINLSGNYSIFILRLLGILVIIINCYLLYEILINFFNKFISLISIFFSLLFILRNYTILNSSLLTGFFYLMFIFLVVQALIENKDYLFFFAGICLTLNIFTDCQNILCLACIFGIFIYYKIANIPNSRQNKQFIPLMSGIFVTFIIILSAMGLLGQLNYYISSVKNSYDLFQNSVGIYSNMDIIKNLKMLSYSYTYWPILIFILFLFTEKLITLTDKKYIYISGILIISILTSYLISNNWESIFVGISFAVLLLYIFNILKCSNEFRLICILSLIMEASLGLGILRSNKSIVYGIWIGMCISFIICANFVLNSYHVQIVMKIDNRVKPIKISCKDSYFILVSLLLIYILCSVKSIYSNFSFLSLDNSPLFCNSNYINTQIKKDTDLNDLNALTKCIEKYKNSSGFLLTQNDMNILYFTTGKAPLLGYTIYDADSVPFSVQISTIVSKNNSYPIVVVKKAATNDTYYRNVTNFIENNNYKSVYKGIKNEIFIPLNTYKK